MPELQWHSPLSRSELPFTTAGFALRELPSVTILRVQALRSRGLSTPAADALLLPATPNASLGDEPIALWKAPDDWLVYSESMTADPLNRWVTRIRSNVPLIATDVSSASVVLELNGERAIDVLMRDCTLDLEGNAIPPGACAQTQFAQTPVLIHRPRSADAWRLFVERSVAAHVLDWLLDTASASV